MLDIDRAWGQPPGWSMSLSAGEQETLIGYHRSRQAKRGPGGR